MTWIDYLRLPSPEDQRIRELEAALDHEQKWTASQVKEIDELEAQLAAERERAERAEERAKEAEVHEQTFFDLQARADALQAQVERLRRILEDLDFRIFTDPQVIERAGAFRSLVAEALDILSPAETQGSEPDMSGQTCLGG